MKDFAAIKAELDQFGQSHLLKFYDSLSRDDQQSLLKELSDIDFAEMDKLIKEYVLNKPKTAIPADLGPAPYYPLAPKNAEQSKLYSDAKTRGVELLKQGKVSCLTVAGGQGTRLGFDGPKGTYPIAPVSGKTLFQYFAESIKRNGQKYGKPITWYIMTSLLNNQQTVDFFEENEFFGLDKSQIFFFTQGTMPAVAYNGKLLLGSKNGLSLSPDGHGGTLLALRKSGALARMKQEGVEYLSYFQVDNPLIPVVDPLFVGLHDLVKSQMSAIMLAKTGPFEKLGNFCVSKGRVEIIEYSDLPADLAEKRNADGTLAFIAGSPAIHVISREFVEDLTKGGSLKLPWHRADKKVPFVDEKGQGVSPTEPNAVKLESFIFDAMPLAEHTMVLEGDRKSLFAPTKNPTGVDSVESCREMIMERDARYLEAAGVKVPRDVAGKLAAKIEISPLVAVSADDVASYVKKIGLAAIDQGSTNYLV